MATGRFPFSVDSLIFFDFLGKRHTPIQFRHKERCLQADMSPVALGQLPGQFPQALLRLQSGHTTQPHLESCGYGSITKKSNKLPSDEPEKTIVRISCKQTNCIMYTQILTIVRPAPTFAIVRATTSFFIFSGTRRALIAPFLTASGTSFNMMASVP